MRRTEGVVPILALLVAGCAPGPPSSTTHELAVPLSEIEALPAEVAFTSPRELVVAGGFLWVLDGAPPFLTRLSLRGTEVLSLGREGEGPGEFRSPVAIQPGTGPDSLGVWVWDLGRGRVTAYDGEGGLLGSSPLEPEARLRIRVDFHRVSFADPFRVRKAGGGFLAARFPQRVDRPSDLLGGALHRTDPRGAGDQELLRFADQVSLAPNRYREWADLPLWDASEEAVALWSPDSSRVLWFDLEGHLDGSALVPLAPAPLRLADIERYLQHMARLELGPEFNDAGIDFAAEAAARREVFAEEAPLATDLRCESGDVAWLRLFSTDSDPLGRSRSWVRVPRSGPALKVTFPEPFTPFLFTPQGVLGMLESPGGLQLAARWHGIMTPEGGSGSLPGPNH